MLNTLFITGTDTAVGKTHVAILLIQALQQKNLSVIGVKPVASGCELMDGAWRNSDALLLQKTSTIALDYACINPIVFLPAIAPHLAAARVQERLSVTRLIKACEPALSAPVDFAVLEGAGGWLVPLNTKETYADFVLTLNCPVLLVVGMRLGCLNHALLTAEAIQSRGARLIGWVANFVEGDLPAAEENLETLITLLTAPCLGVVRHGEDDPASINVDKIIADLSEVS